MRIGTYVVAIILIVVASGCRKTEAPASDTAGTAGTMQTETYAADTMLPDTEVTTSISTMEADTTTSTTGLEEQTTTSKAKTAKRKPSRKH